jgi:WD40 repeat protein
MQRNQFRISTSPGLLTLSYPPCFSANLHQGTGAATSITACKDTSLPKHSTNLNLQSRTHSTHSQNQKYGLASFSALTQLNLSMCGCLVYIVCLWWSTSNSNSVCLQSTQTLTCLAVSEDVTLLAAGHSHSAIRLHSLTEATRAPAPNAQNGSFPSPLTVAQGEACKDLWAHEGPVYSTSFAPDGRLLYSAGCDGTVRVWATEMGANLVVWRGLHQPVWAVKASPIGHWVVSGGADWTCKLWCDSMQTLQLHVLC